MADYAGANPPYNDGPGTTRITSITNMQKTCEQKPSPRSAAAIANRLFPGHAAQVLRTFPQGCIDLIVTSPPYWTAVEYDQGRNPWSSYDSYLADVQSVWNACARVLRPNGKLCVNAPILPIPK